MRDGEHDCSGHQYSCLCPSGRFRVLPRSIANGAAGSRRTSGSNLSSTWHSGTLVLRSRFRPISSTSGFKPVDRQISISRFSLFSSRFRRPRWEPPSSPHSHTSRLCLRIARAKSGLVSCRISKIAARSSAERWLKFAVSAPNRIALVRS